MLAVAALFGTAFLLPAPAPALQHARVAPRSASAVAMRSIGNDAVEFPAMDGTPVRVGIIKARWHEDITDSLVDGVKESITKCGVLPENVFVSEVPGSFELPLAARYLALSGTVDVVVPIGLLIKGDTYHFEVIADNVASSLMSVGLQTGLPIIFGVLTTNTEEQAKDRAFGANNHGLQWGMAAVEMALLRQSALGKKGKMFMGFGAESETEKEAAALGGGGKIGF
jgi:6,7-dimethyl-8-ribityllumazine synthase